MSNAIRRKDQAHCWPTLAKLMGKLQSVSFPLPIQVGKDDLHVWTGFEGGPSLVGAVCLNDAAPPISAVLRFADWAV